MLQLKPKPSGFEGLIGIRDLSRIMENQMENRKLHGNWIDSPSRSIAPGGGITLAALIEKCFELQLLQAHLGYPSLYYMQFPNVNYHQSRKFCLKEALRGLRKSGGMLMGCIANGLCRSLQFESFPTQLRTSIACWKQHLQICSNELAS